MKRILLTFTLLAIIISVTSCKKDEAVTDDVTIADLAGSYVSTDKAIVKPAEMYTKAGVTTDINAIKAFLAQKQQQDQNLNIAITDSSEVYVGKDLCDLTIKYESADVDILTGYFNPKHVQFTGSIKDFSKDEFSIVSPVDSSYVYAYLSPLNINKPTLPADVFKPYSTATGVPGGTLLSAKKLRLVIIGKDIYLPMLRCNRWLNTPTSYEYYSISSGNFSILNPNLRNEMQDGEVIIVQQLLIKMNKK